jgi:hypothetical protein
MATLSPGWSEAVFARDIRSQKRNGDISRTEAKSRRKRLTAQTLCVSKLFETSFAMQGL